MRNLRIRIHCQQKLRIVILHGIQRGDFSGQCLFIAYCESNLIIFHKTIFKPDEINFLITTFANHDLMSRPDKMQIHNILKQTSQVTATQAKQHCSQPDIRKVILLSRAQKLLAFGIIPWNPIKQVTFRQQSNVCFHRMRRNLAPSSCHSISDTLNPRP